jgi:hypothetical protein
MYFRKKPCQLFEVRCEINWVARLRGAMTEFLLMCLGLATAANCERAACLRPNGKPMHFASIETGVAAVPKGVTSKKR